MPNLADRIVLLDGIEAGQVIYLLDSFERLLRFGGLNATQQELLVSGGGVADADAAWQMAAVVLEAAGTIRRQLESPLG